MPSFANNRVSFAAPSTQSALDTELAHVRNAALDAHRDSRPANTRRNYEPKQNEWAEWCATKGYDDGKLVSEAKVHKEARAGEFWTSFDG